MQHSGWLLKGFDGLDKEVKKEERPINGSILSLSSSSSSTNCLVSSESNNPPALTDHNPIPTSASPAFSDQKITPSSLQDRNYSKQFAIASSALEKNSRTHPRHLNNLVLSTAAGAGINLRFQNFLHRLLSRSSRQGLNLSV